MPLETFDTNRKFVRLIEIKESGMVEFEFSVGEPDLFVELLLPAGAFSEFCVANQVTTLDPVRQQPTTAVGDEKDSSLAWSLHSARNKFTQNE